MFQHILVPVDLAYLNTIQRSLEVAAAEAKSHNAPVTYVSVTASGPTRLVNTPEEFQKMLHSFADQQAEAHKIEAKSLALITNDPTTEVDDVLMRAIEETGADLVVMASHKPGFADYFWPSSGGKIASHSTASVFVVRDV